MNKIETLPTVYFHCTRQGISFRVPGNTVIPEAQPIHLVPNTQELASQIEHPELQYPEYFDVETVVKASQSTVRGHLPEE